MAIYRTPDSRFKGLSDFPFFPNYLEVNGMRIHYVDEGTGSVVLLLHGEPTWAYLYRKVIPPLAGRHRVIAFDFVGFGRSDKFTSREAYSFEMHADTMRGVIEALSLEDITLVVHDWGGLIGLPVAAERPDWFSRLVVLNTMLPTGEERKSKAFKAWRHFVRLHPNLPVGRVVQMGTSRKKLSAGVRAAYEAPFPTAESKAGAVEWPLMVPMTPDDPVSPFMREARERLATWEKPAFVLFANEDPVLGGAHTFFRRLLPTAKEQPEVFIKGASHFLQEERGEEIAQHILDFIERTSGE